MDTDLSELLLNSLNEQGYLFQEACEYVLKNSEKQTGWEVKAYEYPVSLAGQDTKVDIILRSKTQNSPELYALLECKRADPSYIYWLFGAPGLPFENAFCSTLGLELREIRADQHPHINRLHTRLKFTLMTYGVRNWMEAKKSSNRRTSTPQNIENAFGQVLKGVEGFAQEQLNQRTKSHVLFKTYFIPVVITTASLYVAYYELTDIDLYTGKISRDKVLFGAKGKSAEEDKWVLLNYGVGENIAPNPIPENYHSVDPTELQKCKIRSIFVVNSRYLTEFFSKLRLS
jgi:hypothetical protein